MTLFSLYPKLIFPARFIRTNGTLIDNCFSRLNKFVLGSTAGIFAKPFSDHQSYFLLKDISLKTKLPPKFVRVNLQIKVAMHSAKNEINSEEIYKLIPI